MKQESPTHPPSPYSYLVLTIDAERNKRGKETSDVFLLFPLCFAQVVRWLVGKRNLAPWVQTRRYGIRHRYNSTSNCGLCDNATRCIVEYLNTHMANSTLVSPIFISRKAHTKKIPPFPFLPIPSPNSPFFIARRKIPPSEKRRPQITIRKKALLALTDPSSPYNSKEKR